jgi:hypothetical protein
MLAICFGVYAVVSADVPQESAASTCKSDFNCSYNGICKQSGCLCDEGWSGTYCHQLKLGPATNSSGLQGLLYGPEKTSTWGGSVLFDHTDGKYHMVSDVTVQVINCIDNHVI